MEEVRLHSTFQEPHVLEFRSMKKTLSPAAFIDEQEQGWNTASVLFLLGLLQHYPILNLHDSETPGLDWIYS